MSWFRTLVCAVVLLPLLSACGSSDTPVPDPTVPPPAAQEQPKAPPAAETEQVHQMQPCMVQNVDSEACTTELNKALADILMSQGEGQAAASQAGEAIANAIKGAPADKRNGFTMTGPDTGQRYSFLFQNEAGMAYLVLFKKSEMGPANEFDLVTSRPMPSCVCNP